MNVLVMVLSELAPALATALGLAALTPLLRRTLRLTSQDEERVASPRDGRGEGGPESPREPESGLIRALLIAHDRSLDLSERINQRAGLQFAWGVVLSVAGLLGFAFLIWLSYSRVDPTPEISATGYNPASSWPEIAATALPRVALVLSIQVLAGFFLRLHRVTMADFHRYERVLQQRKQLLAVARWLETDRTLPAQLRNEFFRMILARPALELVPDGHTTENAQAEDVSRNDVVESVRETGAAVRETITALAGGKKSDEK